MLAEFKAQVNPSLPSDVNTYPDTGVLDTFNLLSVTASLSIFSAVTANPSINDVVIVSEAAMAPRLLISLTVKSKLDCIVEVRVEAD